ncbi:MAG: hypothetical protein OMM_10767, partial [Candidatus Magnetoglobus multicellularis str. Araruama]
QKTPIIKEREMLVSIIIGVILLVLSITLIIQVIKGENTDIDNAVVGGIVFIIFSFFPMLFPVLKSKWGIRKTQSALLLMVTMPGLIWLQH